MYQYIYECAERRKTLNTSFCSPSVNMYSSIEKLLQSMHTNVNHYHYFLLAVALNCEKVSEVKRTAFFKEVCTHWIDNGLLGEFFRSRNLFSIKLLLECCSNQSLEVLYNLFLLILFSIGNVILKNC